MLDLSKRILIIEGVDCSGKSKLAAQLSNIYGLTLIDTDYLRHKFPNNPKDYTQFVAGVNVQQSQFVQSSQGFVKTRYSLTERAYAEYYKRRSVITPQEMEEAGKDKVITLLIDIRYEKYIELSKTRQEEEIFSESEFNLQRELFLTAFIESKLQKGIIVNDGTFGALATEALKTIYRIVNPK